MNPTRIAVTGSRTWKDVRELREHLFRLATSHGGYADDKIVILHGACPDGADRFAAEWCRVTGAKAESFPPDYENHGSRAHAIRNQQMINSADRLIAFRAKGRSNGTDMTVKMALTRGIKVELIQEDFPVWRAACSEAE